MRTRTWIEDTEEKSELNSWYNVSDDSLAGTFYSTWQDSHSKTIEDINTPEYHKLSSEGQIINNPMTMTESEEVSYPLAVHDVRSSQIYYDGSIYLQPTAFGYCALPITDEDEMSDLAIAQAWANVTNSKATALVTLAEGKKSIVGMKSVIDRLLKLIKAVKHMSYRKLKGELNPQQLSDLWLEIRYGLRPLIYDCENIVDAINASNMIKGTRQTFRGHKSDYAFDSDTANNYDASSYTTQAQRTAEVELDVRAGVLCSLKQWSEVENWGLYDVPQAALDLTTFSFIVGWFLNTADLVAAWTPSVSWSTLASWIVVRRKTIQWTGSVETIWRSTGITGGLSGGGITKTVTTTTRVPNPDRPTLPRFDVNLSAEKLIDLVALSRVCFSSISRLRI
jgi:hypothetical protein